MGSDGVFRVGHGWLLVSIRAPAWGATFVIPFFRRRHGVSIRAPAWGATAIMQWQVQTA